MNSDAATPRSAVWREREWWSLAALVLLFFLRPLTTATFFFRDLHYLHFAKKVMLAGALRSGQLPLWDWLTHGGQPFLGNPQSTVFYPTNLLYLPLAPIVAFNVSIVFQFLLCAFGAYWCCRVMRYEPVAAFVGGVVFTFCGYTLSTANLLLPLFGLPWLPLLLGCAEKYFESAHVRWIVLSVFCASMPIFGGAPEIALLSWATVAVWVLAGSRPLGNRFRYLVVVFALAFGVAMVQIVPTLEVIRESSRAKPMAFSSFAGWSVNPKRLPELVEPGFFGRTDSLDETAYWGRNDEDEGFPYILSLYFGVPALLLAAWGTGENPERRRTRALVILAASAVLIALGRHLPLLALLYRMPGAALFRYPVKAIALAVLPVALLAAAGTDRLRTASRRWLHIIAWTAAALMLAVSLLFAGSEAFGRWFIGSMFDSADVRPASLLSGLFLRSALLSAAFGIAVAFLEKRRSIAIFSVAAIVTTDLVVAGIPVNDYAPRDFFASPPAVDAVKRALGGGRLYRTSIPAEFSLKAPSNDIVWFSRWNLQVLSEYTAILYGIPVVFHKDFDGLAPRRVVELGDAVRNSTWRERIPVLAKAGCRAFMTTDLIRNPAAHPIAVLPNASNHPLYLYGIDGGGLAWLTSNVAQQSRDSLRQAIASGVTVVDGPPVAPCGDAPARVLDQTWRSLDLLVTARCESYVYLAVTRYPGWRAYVDGNEARIARANYAFSSVRVPAGRHQVRLEYQPQSLELGLVGSVLSLLALSAFALYSRRSSLA